MAATSETILVRISRARRVTPGMLRITVAFDPRDVHLIRPGLWRSRHQVARAHRHRSAAKEIETFLGESIDLESRKRVFPLDRRAH